MFDLSIDGQIARLTLNRPAARNAIPAGEWPSLAAAVDQAEQSGAHVLLVTGAGGSFCAGADLSDFKAMHGDADMRVRFRQSMRQALGRLQGSTIVTVALIEGSCFGAGVALAMACDLRIAGTGASFAIPPAKLGISYPQEDISNLVTLVGPGQAARLLFSAEAIDGAEAARIGLVERDAGLALSATVETLAATMAAYSGSSLAALKGGIRLAAAGVAQDEGQDARFDALLGSDDMLERLYRLRPPPRR